MRNDRALKRIGGNDEAAAACKPYSCGARAALVRR
jgi:hypothetical protein